MSFPSFFVCLRFSYCRISLARPVRLFSFWLSWTYELVSYQTIYFFRCSVSNNDNPPRRNQRRTCVYQSKQFRTRENLRRIFFRLRPPPMTKDVDLYVITDTIQGPHTKPAVHVAVCFVENRIFDMKKRFSHVTDINFPIDYHNTGSSFGCWKPTGTWLCTSQNYSKLPRW